MMRELKARPIRVLLCDEVAAAQIPMMRELKVRALYTCSSTMPCCSPNPYDEGTERLEKEKGKLVDVGCSPNPYDEGTESR